MSWYPRRQVIDANYNVFKNLSGGSSASPVPAPSTLAEWDANENLSAAGFLALETSTVGSSTPIVMTNASTQVQTITGTVAQTITLPTTSIKAGYSCIINNNMSGANVTVQASDGSVVGLVGVGQAGIFRAWIDTPVTTANWAGDIKAAGTVLDIYSNSLIGINHNGTQTLYTLPTTSVPAASTLAKWDAQANLSADQFLPSVTTTAASATPITLGINSTRTQVITGTTTPQTITLPSTSVQPGYEYVVVSQITSANISVRASDGTAVATLLPGETGVFRASTAAPTTNTQWSSSLRLSQLDVRYEPLEQYAALPAAYTLASQTAAQQLLNTTTSGALTLPVGQYFFECGFSLTGMSSTSGAFGFGFGGTATFTQEWAATAAKPASAIAGAPTFGWYTANSTNLIGAGNVNTNGVALIRGTLNATTGGTLIPQVSLTQAAAAVVGAGSYFRIQSVQSTAAYAGNWS